MSMQEYFSNTSLCKISLEFLVHMLHPLGEGEGEIKLCLCASSLTSLQSVLCDRAAVDAKAGSGVGSHLDLVLGPDDQIFQQTVVGLGAADVLLLVVPR